MIFLHSSNKGGQNPNPQTINRPAPPQGSSPKSNRYKLKTHESQLVESVLKEHFAIVNTYQYNSASIRIRVIDDCFYNVDEENRIKMIEPFLENLSDEIQQNIIFVLTLYPGEQNKSITKNEINERFENRSYYPSEEV